MKVLLVAQVEDLSIEKEIAKQTVKPDEQFIYLDQNPAKIDWTLPPEQIMSARRKRIAGNHQKLKEAVEKSDCDYVWQVEGDCLLPENALETLLKDFIDLPDAGYISGIQVGRHGVRCLGAWVNFTDISFESVDYKLKGLRKVEATGFYCLLAKKSAWLEGKCEWNGEVWGPDVNWSRSIKSKKYVNMDLQIGHKTKRGIIKVSDMSTCNAKFYRENGQWKYRQL